MIIVQKAFSFSHILKAQSLARICLKIWQTVTKAVGHIQRLKKKKKPYTNAVAQLEPFHSSTLRLLKATQGKIINDVHTKALSSASHTFWSYANLDSFGYQEWRRTSYK